MVCDGRCSKMEESGLSSDRQAISFPGRSSGVFLTVCSAVYPPPKRSSSQRSGTFASEHNLNKKSSYFSFEYTIFEKSMASTVAMTYPSDPRRVVVFPQQQQAQAQAQAYAQQRHRASQYTRMAAIDEYDLPPRPTRQHKISHRGASGLFDDIDERSYRNAHEMHQVQRPQGGAHQSAKEERAARRVAMGKPAESRFEGFVTRVFTRQSRKEADVEEGKEEDDERSTTEIRGKSIVEETAIYQQKEAAAAAAAAASDSLFLRECGMVRVETNVPGGCIIVPRNFVYREDFTYREDRDAGWI